MFTDLTMQWQQVSEVLGQSQYALGVALLACIVAVGVMLKSRRSVKAMEQRLSKLEHDLKISSSSQVAMGRQLIQMEKQLHQSVSSQTATSSAPAVAAPVSEETVAKQLGSSQSQRLTQAAGSQSESQANRLYDEARLGLSQGKSVADVAKECGLSYAEVSLLQALGRHSVPSQQS